VFEELLTKSLHDGTRKARAPKNTSPHTPRNRIASGCAMARRLSWLGAARYGADFRATVRLRKD
jgi:hypothetical protein